MNLDMNWGDLARASGGILVCGEPEAAVDSISIDSRTLSPRQAFWALRGRRTDGHQYLAQAGNAAGWVVERGRALPDAHPRHVVEVSDTLKALQALAASHRRRFDIPVAAITGSNGKTSTKDMLRSICALGGPVCATSGNLNNQFGTPLSVLELDSSHRYGVFEMGASHPGDIDELTRIVQPTVGILTNIAPAHLEYFGSIEGVFKTKAELISASGPETRIAINIDDPWLANLEAQLGARAVTFGTSERAQVRLLDEADGSFTLVILRHRVPVALSAPGRIHRLNAAAAAAGAVGLGISPAAIAEGLGRFKPSPMRFEARTHPSGTLLLVDAYNANPGSMRAAIQSFCDAYPRLKRVLVLGDMKELGPQSQAQHRELGEWISGLPVEAVYLAGADMAHAAQAIGKRNPAIQVVHGAQNAAWSGDLRRRLGAGTAIFFKASRAMEFERLIDSL